MAIKQTSEITQHSFHSLPRLNELAIGPVGVRQFDVCVKLQ